MRSPDPIPAYRGWRAYAVTSRGRTADGWYWRAQRGKGKSRQTKSLGRQASRDDALDALIALATAPPPQDLAPGEVAITTLNRLFGAYLNAIEAAGAIEPGTFDAYERRLRRAQPHIGAVDPLQVRTEDLRRLRDALRKEITRRGKPMAWSTISEILVTVRAAIRWGAQEGLAAPAPALPPRLTQRRRAEGRQYNHATPTRAEILQLLERLDERIATGLRGEDRINYQTRRALPVLRRAIWLGWCTGARPSEVCFAEWSDLNLETGALRLGIYVGGRKTGIREVSVPAEILLKLRGEQAASSSTRIVGWSGIRPAARFTDQLKRFQTNEKLRLWPPMGLRRHADEALIQQLGKKAVSLADYREIMGHSAQRAVAAYLNSDQVGRAAATRAAGLGVLPQGELIDLSKRREEGR